MTEDDGPHVVIASVRYRLDPIAPLVFGRRTAAGVVGLDPGDRGISAVAGSVGFHEGWVISNLSRGRPLFVEYPNVIRHHQVAPGSQLRLSGPGTLLVAGSVYTHAISLNVPAPPEPPGLQMTTPDERTESYTLTEDEHLAIVAVAVGYLRRWPRHDPHPLPYSAAAPLIDATPTALRRRLDHLRESLRTEIDLETSGPHALRSLIEYCIDCGLLAVADLALLPPGQVEGPPP